MIDYISALSVQRYEMLHTVYMELRGVLAVENEMKAQKQRGNLHFCFILFTFEEQM